ncbi:MAG: hypothetical protein Q9182_000537 [Xanthomendoza sp. 2 TL-2023]
MGIKRSRDTADDAINRSDISVKKAKKGFSVGPGNLPDGTHRRKVKKIKDNLVHKAKVKKSYKKIKDREPVVLPKYYTQHALSEVEQPPQEPASMDLHPARQAMLDVPDRPAVPKTSEDPKQPRRKRPRKPKPVPYEKEVRLAQQRKVEIDAKREAAENARLERQRKMEDRERFRKAVAKARTGGKNGQRKLGRESKILLERVQNLVAD